MKKISLSVITLFVAFTCFAQKTDGRTYNELKRKSHQALTTGIVMVSTGPVIAAGGIGSIIYGLIIRDDNYNYTTDIYGNTISRYDRTESDQALVIGTVAAATGIALALTSIHFMNKANHFRSLARAKLKTTTQNINIPGIRNDFSYAPTKQIQFTLSIPLGK